MAQINFDATHIKPNEGFGDPIPAGWYRAVIDESEIRPTKEGDGQRLNLRFMVIDGQYTNRKVFEGLNLVNKSDKAVEIAKGQLSAICHALGILQVGDSAQLHNQPLFIKVKIRKDKDGQYEDRNEITSFKNINDPTVLAALVAPSAPGTGFYTPPAPVQPWQQPAAQQPWQQPQQPAAAPAPTPAPAPWTPPGAAPGAAPWQHQPPQQPAQQVQQPAQPPHPAQSAPPPWQQPQQPAGAPAGNVPPWQQPRQ